MIIVDNLKNTSRHLDSIFESQKSQTWISNFWISRLQSFVRLNLLKRW